MRMPNSCSGSKGKAWNSEIYIKLIFKSVSK